MREETIPTGQKELHRWHLMKMADAGNITLKEVAEKRDCVLPEGEMDSEGDSGIGG